MASHGWLSITAAINMCVVHAAVQTGLQNKFHFKKCLQQWLQPGKSCIKNTKITTLKQLQRVK